MEFIMKDPKNKSKMRTVIYILVCLAVIVSGVIFFFDPYIARFGMWTIVQRNKMTAERGDIDAMLELATLYSIGHYIKRDVPETVKWLRKAAELGDAKAQYELGFYYDAGDGVPQDLAEAVNWWHRAAAQGNMDAQNHIGACYAEGYGVPQNIEAAIAWWTKAAEQGHGYAKKNIGLFENPH
jgi:TPR repeat protein